jgi:aspartate aminotransferase
VIPPELQELLEPLERFESLRRRAARLGSRLSDLSYANPYERVGADARAVLVETLADERSLDLQYSPFGGQTLSRRAVADALRDSHRLAFGFEHIVLTPGAMAALHLALRASCDPGDEVLVPVPCWLDYPLYARALGLVPRLVPLSPGSFDLDVDALSAALSSRTRAVLLSHPANPTGRMYGGDALADLGDALRQAEGSLGCRVTLIADETHRDFVPADAYSSAASFFARTIIVYSFGKYHFMQGQRLGYAAASPQHPAPELAAEMVRWTRITGIATPTALMQRAVPRLLALRHDLGWLSRWRVRVLDELRGAGYEPVEPDGTLFVYVPTPPGHSDDFEFVSELAARRVLALPAPVFHHEGYFRLSLTGSERMLLEALPALREMAPA